MPDSAVRHLTIDEFFAWYPTDDDRHWQLFDGRPVAMTPPSSAHQILVVNFARRIAEALDARPGCTVRAEAGIIPDGRTDSYYQADLAVTCRPHESDDPRHVREPILIVEILSPSTQATDRRRKLPDYRDIRSVREIVLIDAECLYCEVHRRLDGDRWLVDLLRDRDGVLKLECIDLALPLGLLYANIALAGDDGNGDQPSPS